MKKKWYGKMVCGRCGYEWQSRRRTPPARCPNCGFRAISPVLEFSGRDGCAIILLIFLALYVCGNLANLTSPTLEPTPRVSKTLPTNTSGPLATPTIAPTSTSLGGIIYAEPIRKQIYLEWVDAQNSKVGDEDVWQEIARRWGITVDAVEDIVVEGLNKNWLQPAATGTPTPVVSTLTPIPPTATPMPMPTPTRTPTPTPTETPYVGEWISPYAVYDKCGEEPGHPASAFIDGDTGTYWEHDANERHWVVVDLGSSWTVQKIRVYVAAPALCDWDSVDIHISQDGSTWGTVVMVGVSIAGGPGWMEYDVTDKAGRYIKLSGIDTRSADQYVRGHEVEVFVK